MDKRRAVEEFKEIGRALEHALRHQSSTASRTEENAAATNLRPANVARRARFRSLTRTGGRGVEPRSVSGCLHNAGENEAVEPFAVGSRDDGRLVLEMRPNQPSRIASIVSSRNTRRAVRAETVEIAKGL